jgi:hypothetical protein
VTSEDRCRFSIGYSATISENKGKYEERQILTELSDPESQNGSPIDSENEIN